MAFCPRIKKQCPETNRGKKGCCFWLIPGELPLINAKSSDKFPAKGMCSEHIKIFMLWDANFSLLGNQQATESFRNGMIEVDEKGRTRPKSDLLTATLLKVFTTKPETHAQMIENVETIMIEDVNDDKDSS